MALMPRDYPRDLELAPEAAKQKMLNSFWLDARSAKCKMHTRRLCGRNSWSIVRGHSQLEGSMLRRSLLSVWLTLAVVLTTGAPLAVTAQDATPGASPVAGAPPVVASGLTNPRGMTWGADGTLFVALAGNGGTSPAVGEFLPPPAGPEVGGGPSAAVARIDPEGCPVAVATELPSSLDLLGSVVGVSDIAILGDQLYALVAGGGGSHGK